MTNQNQELIGKYLNHIGYSDVNPIGKVIGTKGKTIAIVKRVIAEEQVTKLQWITGGFSGICTNQCNQEWKYEETEEVFEVRLSKQYLKSVSIDENPRKFYDYNF
jgi:hypothetical protein